MVEDQEWRVYDILVIGGGPGGALAATLASQKGFSTLLLERKKIPRPKICGGFISARALKLLPEGLIKDLKCSYPLHILEVRKGRQTYRFQSKAACGILVERAGFDSLLLERAQNSGAVIADRCAAIRIIETGHPQRGETVYRISIKGKSISSFYARYIVGADGAYGTTAQLSGLRNRKRCLSGLAYSIVRQRQFRKEDKLTFFPHPLLGGMSWSFEAGTICNMGSGGLCRKKTLKKIMARLFKLSPEDKISGGWPLPFSGPLNKNTVNNILLIGDAAGLIEPFSGEGIYNAFKSARLAVKAIAEADVRGVKAATIYGPLFNKHFRKYFWANLIGAAYLHTLFIFAPARLPAKMASLMENKLWFNDPYLPDE